MIINKDIIQFCKDRDFEEPKFHAVFCDPPYELGFMGKTWDSTGIAFDPKTWKAIADQCYPGAYLLAFGGTRTFHRIAVAIEDAGFEIRDTVMYLYGSGFPKSHNFGCKCQRGAVQYTHDEGAKTTPEHDLRPLQETDLSSAKRDAEKQDKDVQSSLSELSSGKQAPTHAREHSETTDVRSQEPSMEGRGDVLAQARELQADKVRPLSEGVSADGSEGRLHHGTSAVDGAEIEPTTDTDGGSSPHQPRPAGQSAGEPDAVSEQQGTQTARVERGTCPKCGGLTDWQGFGSALKPAYEPIIVARLPLDGTLRQNAQRYGSGALNIDGTRVGTETEIHSNGKRSMYGGSALLESKTHNDKSEVRNYGRWPANLIHDGSDEVVGVFPNTKAGVAVRSKSGGNTFGGENPKPPLEDLGYADSGSAARFFYSAKVSKRERDAGLEGFEEKELNALGNFEGTPEHGPKLNVRTRNNHPTLKPLSLTKYLATLILPPKLDQPRRLLVPFAGAGSEVIGALQAGWDEVVGVEQSKEYCDIAEARIKHWTE